jgi:hypothetical protein
MCYAVQGSNPLWKNTNVTVCNICAVFKHSPCLICVLAKKRKEGMAQWKPRKKYKKLRIGKELSDTKDLKSLTTKEMNQQDVSDTKRYKPGNCSAATTLDQSTPSHLRDTSSHSYGEIQAPSVCSPTRAKKHPRMCTWKD